MPSRILRESFVTSETVASLPPAVQDRLPRYFLLTDDFGCFQFQPQVIAGRIWPLRPDMTAERIKADIEAYASAEILQLFDGTDGKHYAWFPHWWLHNRPAKANAVRKTPAPPGHSGNGRDGPGNTGNGQAGPGRAGTGLPQLQLQSQSQSQSQAQKKEDPPLPPVNGGRTSRNLPRLKKRQKRATTLAEDLRFQLEAQRDAWSRALHRALKSQPGMSREDQIAWVQRRCVGAQGELPTEEQAEDIVGLVEASVAGARA